MRVIAETDWSQGEECYFKVLDGTTGDRVAASGKYVPDDGSPGVETGWGAQRLGDKDKDGDGETTFQESGAALVGQAHRPGTLVLWLRDPTSDQPDPPLMADGVPMVTTVRVP